MRITSIIAAVLLLFSSVSYADESAQKLVEDTTAAVLKILNDNKDELAENTPMVQKLIEDKVVPHVDFVAMTKLAVAVNWKRANQDQQHALVSEFKSLLLRTYSKSISEYSGEQIIFLPYRPESRADRAVVRAEFAGNGGSKIPIHYKLRKKEDWKIYDISIDGISLVTNYRSSFSSEIQASGIDGLVASLKLKNQGGE